MRSASIRTKLTCALACGCLLTLMLTTAAFVVNDVRMIEANLVDQHTTLADTLGANCATAIIFDDSLVADDVLSSLKLNPSVLQADVTTASGERFATYHNAGETQTAAGLSDELAERAIRIKRSIHHNDEVVGAIELLVSRSAVRQQLKRYATISFIVFVVAGCLSIALASWIGRMIGQPVTELAEITRQISSTGDYSTRVPVNSTDETGQLCLSFNTMLEQIQSRDDQLHRAMEEVEEARRLADAANTSKSDFLANMSHEIRTPMTAILGFADLLRRGADGGDEEERQDYINTIYGSGKHLLTLINDILDLSKIEAGRMEIDLIDGSPHQIIAEAVSVMRVRALEKGLTLEYTWTGKIPSTICTDPSRLRQLLINLIGNAVKFTEVGGVQVVAQLVEMQERPCLEIAVIDSGIGIPQQKLEGIFDPFSQADASVTRRFGGTGLGLTISRRIAEALGGELTVESEFGLGSSFVVRIDPGSLDGVELLSTPPVADVVDLNSGLSGEFPPLPQKLRVLLVEDGETNRRLINLILSRHGIDVVDAENGQIGVNLATKQQFDLILMDMQMPVMDGYAAAHELRGRGLTVPIVALTAHAMKGDEEKCLAAGCTDYVTKPINESRLLEKISHVLGSGAADSQYPSDAAETGTQAHGPIHSSLPTDDDEFRAIVGEFAQRLNEKVLEMEAAAAGEQHETLMELGHWLKGSGGTAGFEQLTFPASRLEHLAQTRAGVAQLADAVADIAAIADRIDAGLSERLATAIP